MDCNLKEIKEQIHTDIKTALSSHFGNSITISEGGGISFTDDGKLVDKHANIKEKNEQAEKIINKVLTDNKISEKLKGGWVSYDNRTNTSRFYMPNYVAASIQSSIDIKSKEEQRNIQAMKEVDVLELNGQYSLAMMPNFTADVEPDFNPDAIEMDKPHSLAEYVVYKQNLLVKIKESFEKFKKLNKYGTEKYIQGAKKFTESIDNLEKGLAKIDITDANIIYQDIMSEVLYMNDLLKNFSINDLDATELLDRIDTFSGFFNQQTREGKVAMGKGLLLDSLDILNIGEIESSVRKLRNDYQEKRHELIISMLYEDSHFQKHVDDGTYNEDQIADILKDIDEIEDIDMLSKLMLGADTGGGILGQLLFGQYNKKMKEKQSETVPLTTKLETLFAKIKGKVDNTVFYSRDSNGVINNKLISKFTDKYIKTIYEFINLQKEFYKATGTNKTKAYENLMQQRKNTVEYIDISKLQAFKTMYGQDSNLNSRHFKYTNDEMSTYEQELKDKLGLHYATVIKEAFKKVSNYENFVRDNIGSNEKIFAQNPFVFINHFNSPNYSRGHEQYSNILPYSNYAAAIPLKTTKDINTEEEESTGFYDTNFDKIEQDPDVYNTWQTMHTLLTEHINPVLTSMGQKLNLLDLPALEDLNAEEIVKTRSFLGKMTQPLKNLVTGYVKLFVNSSYNNIKTRKEDTISLQYHSSIKQKAKDMSDLLMNNSLAQLQELATQNGINVTDIQSDLDSIQSKQDKQKFENAHKRSLSNSIANKQVYAKTSKDLLSNIVNLTNITNNALAREESIAIANVVTDYIQSKITASDPKGNLQVFMNAWVKRNLYGDSIHVDRKKKYIADAVSKEIGFLGKNLNTFEKDLKKMINNELVNIDSKEDFNFRFGDTSYTQEDGNYFSLSEGKKLAITKEVIIEQYEKYLTEKLDSLGVKYTVGSIAVGIMGAIAMKSLGLNPKSGIKNRFEGMFKNLIFSAGGRFFTDEQYDNARSFLALINADKYLNSFNTSKSLSIRGRQHALQIKTFKMFSNSFGLMQDKKNQLATIDEEKTAYTKLAETIMAIAIDNPETHNQGEIMLGVYQNVKIMDNKGVEHQLFNGKEFTPYIPGTLQLKPEFKSTDSANPAYNNSTKFENFEDIEGDTNNLSTAFLTIDSAIKRIQGNYSDKDVILMQGGTWGKLMMLFQRYIGEHTFANYGSKRTDLITGTQNYEGRKLFLFKHAPSAAMYLGINTALTVGAVGGVLATFTAAPAVFAIGAGMAATTWLAQLAIPFVAFATRKFFFKNVNTEVKISWKETKLALDFTQETFARILDTPLRFITYGKNKKILDTVSLSSKISKKYFSDTPITEKERRILSESAQELANKATIMLGVIVGKYAMQAAYLAFAGDDDDDDTKADKLKSIQMYLNFLGNAGDMLIGDVDKYTNPKMFITQASQFIFFKKINDLFNFVDFLNEENTKVKEYSPTDLILDLPFNPIPKQITDIAFKDGTNLLGDAREYETNWWDIYAKKDSYVSDKLLEKKRNAYKTEYQGYIKDKIKENNPAIADEVLEDLVKSYTTAKMKGADVNKAEGEESKAALERIDFDKEVENIGE